MKAIINVGADIEEIAVIRGHHLEFLDNLRNLVWIVLDVAHHEVILLGDDVPGHQDVWGQTLSADVLKQHRRLHIVLLSTAECGTISTPSKPLTSCMKMLALDSSCSSDCFFMVA